ncbi:bacteriocin-like WGxF protein [Niallia sp. BSM11]|uniref:bacteriocin-like WGxF protein n=1 Tax=Niallia sp. BSM11 TaxID=3391576 RepID=UPI0039852423
MKIVGLSFINVILILFTVLIHKIIYRVLLLNYDSLALYWGIFVAVFFVLNVVVNSLFLKKTIGSRER